MEIVDIIIFLFLLFWTVIGLTKGFVNEVVSLLCWSFALYFSVNHNDIPSQYIFSFIQSPELANILSYIFIFIIAFVATILLGFFSTQMVKILGFSSSNAALGFFIGFIKGNIFLIIIIYGFSLTELTATTYWEQSQFIPFFEDFIQNFIKSHDSLFDSLDLKI